MASVWPFRGTSTKRQRREIALDQRDVCRKARDALVHIIEWLQIGSDYHPICMMHSILLLCTVAGKPPHSCPDNVHALKTAARETGQANPGLDATGKPP
jgi:hypothetical protein